MYRHGENILIFSSKTLVPGAEALKNMLRYMDKEKKAFRTGVALRFVNMLLLVVEPLLAARIITAFNASIPEKVLMLAILMALLEAAKYSSMARTSPDWIRTASAGTSAWSARCPIFST